MIGSSDGMGWDGMGWDQMGSDGSDGSDALVLCTLSVIQKHDILFLGCFLPEQECCRPFCFEKIYVFCFLIAVYYLNSSNVVIRNIRINSFDVSEKNRRRETYILFLVAVSSLNSNRPAHRPDDRVLIGQIGRAHV